MRWAKSAFESRFGLRILMVFTASAIVPMLILAALAYTSTRDQLEADALVSLRRDVKSAAMSIAEQIEIGAAQLDLAATSTARPNKRSLNAFVRIEQIDPSESDLTPLQREHLQRGRPLLLTSGAGATGVRLMREIGDRIWVGFFREQFLFKPERLSRGERYWVTDESGRYLFGVSSDDFTRDLAAVVASVETRIPFELESPTGAELALVWPLFLKGPYLSPELRVALSRSKLSIHRPLEDFRFDFAIALLLGLLGSAGIAMHQIRIRVRPLEEIMRATHQIEKGIFSVRTKISSGDEFELIGSSINAMAQKLEDDFRTLETLRGVSDALLDAENRQVIAKQILGAALQFSTANGAAFLVVERDPKARFRSLVEVEIDGFGSLSSGREGDRLDRFEFAESALTGNDFVLAMRSEDEGAAACRALDGFAGSRVEAVLAIPLNSGSGDAEGVLQLVFFDARDRVLLTLADVRALSILAGQGGAALKNIAWIEDLRGLFEGVIRLIVNAIDEKSPYTGDHCRRVPILTELIADAVCQDAVGPFKDFSLTEDERYELKIAALLHDCGKVATPVHVMDKATKLETIHDRIELIRLRAEIVKRDLRGEALRKRLEAKGTTASEDCAQDDAIARLEDDLAFIERCNVGGEAMQESHRQRIGEISASYQWTDGAGRDHPLISDEEAMNLKIRRGTLNDDEREIINNHVVTTIRLLEELPFPAELRNVPEIAGAHHECVDGNGYPQGLGADELSTQSRILGLADVFEALTSRTRPYKAGKSLSETLQILEDMVEAGQLDRDLHEIFVREKVYLKYAAEFVASDQIDEAHYADLESLTASWTA